MRFDSPWSTGPAHFAPTTTTTYGWCETHPGNDHNKGADCVGFVSDADYTAQMLREAAEHERRAGDGGAEARYVEQHRPY